MTDWLYRNLRSLRKRLVGHSTPLLPTKKLTRLQDNSKIDQIIAANPGKSLNELLAEKKINADQKYRVENKPNVEASIKNVEERLTHYKKFEDELHQRYATEKKSTETTHSLALETAKEEAYQKGRAEAKEEFRANLLTLSRFLRAAAEVRQTEEKPVDSEAFEGALLLVYGGDETAVNSIERLFERSEEQIPSTSQIPSGYTCECPNQSCMLQALTVPQSSKFATAPTRLRPARARSPRTNLLPRQRRRLYTNLLRLLPRVTPP